MNTSVKTQLINLKIGEYEIHPLPTGEFGLDGGAMFGTVPKILWEKSNPADQKNRIKMEARGLLLKGKNQNIIIDCGNGGDFKEKYGDKLGSKFADIYNVNSSIDNSNSLLKSLSKYGLSAGDIDKVILTHLHFDHAGGATHFFEGKIQPTFPNAEYFLQEKNLEVAKNPNVREKASYLTANYEPLIDTKCLTLLRGESEIVPGVRTWISNGHTQGHQMVLVEDSKLSLIYCGDVVPTSSHVRLAWLMGYDINPLVLIEEKSKYLKIACQKNSYLFFEHDPYCDLAKISDSGSDFLVTQKFLLA